MFEIPQRYFVGYPPFTKTQWRYRCRVCWDEKAEIKPSFQQLHGVWLCKYHLEKAIEERYVN